MDNGKVWTNGEIAAIMRGLEGAESNLLGRAQMRHAFGVLATALGLAEAEEAEPELIWAGVKLQVRLSSWVDSEGNAHWSEVEA